MSRVLTNEQNYYNIADTIRQMKNVNTTYKPREMASALKDIYSNEVEGILPLSFEANGNNLLDYRIDGASGGVGDRTDNLFDGILLDGYYTDNTLTTLTSSTGIYKSLKVNLPAGTYTVVYSEAVLIIRYIELNGDYMTNPAGKSTVESYTFTLNSNSTISLGFRNSTNTQWDDSIKIQVVTGSIVPSKYEPYGYKVPVLCGGTTTNIYLDEPIEENESISLSDTEVDIPTIEGTNTLTIDTTVQPSNVYVQAPKDSEEIVYLTTILEEEI